jgi:hypothetical protein
MNLIVWMAVGLGLEVWGTKRKCIRYLRFSAKGRNVALI